MKLSVIIPNYNNELFLKKCLHSLEIQEFKDFEVIIIDDGSTDNSNDIIENFIKKTKLKVKYIKQFNQNAAIARNRGIEVANGEFVFFLDSDDEIYSKDTLKRVAENLTDCDLLTSNYIVIDTDNKIINNYNPNDFLVDLKEQFKYCNVSPVPSNKIYKRSIITDKNIYFSNVRIGQDLNFYLKYLLFAKKIKYIDICMYKYRIVDSGITRSLNLNFLDIYNSINEVRKFYIKNNSIDIYDNISFVGLRHYTNQIERVERFKNRKCKKMIYAFFDYCVFDNFVMSKNKYYKKQYKLYCIKKLLLKLHLYQLYKKIK